MLSCTTDLALRWYSPVQWAPIKIKEVAQNSAPTSGHVGAELSGFGLKKIAAKRRREREGTQHRAGDAQDGERGIHQDMCRAAAERRRNEVGGEGVGDVGHADRAQYGPQRATESLLQCRNREQCQHVKHHSRRHEEDEHAHPRCGADPTEPNDQEEMDQMGSGEGEAEIAAMAPKELGGGADQQGETAAGIGKPEQKEREAGGDLQGMAGAQLAGAEDRQHDRRERGVRSESRSHPPQGLATDLLTAYPHGSTGNVEGFEDGHGSQFTRLAVWCKRQLQAFSM